MKLREKLIEAKNLYCASTSLSSATVGTKVANDGKFFDRVEGGGSLTIETYEKVMQWFEENTPKSVKKSNNNKIAPK